MQGQGAGARAKAAPGPRNNQHESTFMTKSCYTSHDNHTMHARQHDIFVRPSIGMNQLCACELCLAVNAVERN